MARVSLTRRGSTVIGRCIVVDHLWRSPQELADLLRRLGPHADLRSFVLTLPFEENLQRIERRASTRAIDELEYERRAFVEERKELTAWSGGELGEAFAVDAAPQDLADRLMRLLGFS